MKPLTGFRKRGSTFERRHGETVQLVELQRSRDGATFYVNVGIVFDAVAELGGSSTGALVLGKTPVHYGARLETLVDGLPARWPKAALDDDDGALVAGIARAVELLDRIDGPAAALTVLDLDRGFEKRLRAQLKHVTGDREGAIRDIEAVANEFSDRRGCSVDELLARSGLR